MSSKKLGTWQNDEQVIRRVLKESKTIALVGASNKAERASNHVMSTMQQMGYKVIPINPALAKQNELLHGERVYSDLQSVSAEYTIDMVDIFRASNAAGQFVDEAIEIGAKSVWLQLGVVDEEAGKRAVDAGLMVVMDTCPLMEFPKLGISGPDDEISSL
eukprot:CAMPEP_0201689512 /NCGR_PEP_ID=MMETSP0578-20130828/3093_1 /ASSEMBLY_ACC=CAM_ASM_000663 /TAXON_ID=267565 /ORGANISM="Skeletonema grethea, Strain CCMP 1804" /LENGTH=159 /DNA_ID=CAMNT_0048174179 /DNA_START=178 /DNA_END=657 /DNA_ORIENTATION=-